MLQPHDVFIFAHYLYTILILFLALAYYVPAVGCKFHVILQGNFMQYDRDRSGSIEPHELHACIESFGYQLTPQALNIIVKRYSTNGSIMFDDFVSVCIRLRMLNGEFNLFNIYIIYTSYIIHMHS